MATLSIAQTENRPFEPSYEVSLQLILGSNEAGSGAEIPANLSSLSKQFKNTFPFRNYRLAGTFLGRVTNTGNFEYKSTSNMFGQESERARPVFLDWSLGNLRSGPTAKGGPGFQAQSFRFGARVPVTVATLAEGKTNSVVNYEPIGLTLGKVGLAENSPTLMGTLNLPGAEGTVFLVMTVRSSDL